MLSDYDKGFFKPAFLIGVETTKGFINDVVETDFCGINVYTTESLSKEDLYDVHSIKYFISDVSDETVSFREYIEMFYET